MNQCYEAYKTHAERGNTWKMLQRLDEFYKKLMEGELNMQWVKLEGSLRDKIKIEALEANSKTLEQANAELTVTVDNILTEVIPSIMEV